MLWEEDAFHPQNDYYTSINNALYGKIAPHPSFPTIFPNSVPTTSHHHGHNTYSQVPMPTHALLFPTVTDIKKLHVNGMAIESDSGFVPLPPKITIGVIVKSYVGVI